MFRNTQPSVCESIQEGYCDWAAKPGAMKVWYTLAGLFKILWLWLFACCPVQLMAVWITKVKYNKY